MKRTCAVFLVEGQKSTYTNLRIRRIIISFLNFFFSDQNDLIISFIIKFSYTSKAFTIYQENIQW